MDDDVQPSVVVLLPDSPQVVTSVLAAMVCGYEVTVLNPLLTENELKPQMKELCPDLLVTNTRYLSKGMQASYFSSDTTFVGKILLLPSAFEEQKSESVDLIVNRFSQQNLVSYEQLLHTLTDEDLAAVEDYSQEYTLSIFTFKSGRHKSPRLVSFHASQLTWLMDQLTADGALESLDQHSRVLGMTPFFVLHTFISICVSLRAGATYICHAENHDRNMTVAIQNVSATHIVLAPSHIRSLVLTEQSKWAGADCSSLQGIVCFASCPVDTQMAEFALSLLGCAYAQDDLFLHQVYGACSLAPFTHSNRIVHAEMGSVDKIHESVKQLLRRNRNVNREGFVPVGKCLNGVECVVAPLPRGYATVGYTEEVNRKVLRDDCKEVGTNIIGELCVRSRSIPVVTRTSGKNIQDSYLYTGEVGYVDENGNHFVLPAFNRRQVLCIDGSELSPAEIESALLKCSGVSSAHVFACPHPKGYPSEFIAKAMIVPNEVATFRKGSLSVKIRDSVLAQLKTYLSEFKIPNFRYRDKNGIVLTEELPMINDSVVDHWRIHADNAGPRNLAYFANALRCPTIPPLDEVVDVETKESLSSFESAEDKGFTTPPAPPMDDLKPLHTQNEELKTMNAKLKKEKAKMRKETILLLEKLEETQKTQADFKEQVRQALRNAKQADNLLSAKRKENESLCAEVEQLKAQIEDLKQAKTMQAKASGDAQSEMHILSNEVKSMKQEVETWKQRCSMYQNSLKRQQVALTESEEKLRLANTMRQREHEENAFRLKRLNEALNQLKAKNPSTKKKAAAEKSLYDPAVITRLLNASREEIRHLMKCRIRHMKQNESLKTMETTLKARNEHLENLCHRLNVENSVAVDFMLKLNAKKQAEESAALLGSPESKLLVDPQCRSCR